MRILLAEDTEINQQLGLRLLQRFGHQVTLARDGREAVSRYLAAPSAYDLILMDLQMPLMDGMQATAAIRRHEREHGGHVPILALTAHDASSVLQRCVDGGMDGCVTKPLDVTQVESGLADARRATGASPPSSPVIGWDAALDLVLGDEALLCRMARLFLGQTDEMLADIAAAHRRGAAQDLERAAHRLKGSVGNFGAEEARGLAGRIEAAARAGDLHGAGTLLPPLAAAMAIVCAELEARLARSDRGRS